MILQSDLNMSCRIMHVENSEEPGVSVLGMYLPHQLEGTTFGKDGGSYVVEKGECGGNFKFHPSYWSWRVGVGLSQ